MLRKRGGKMEIDPFNIGAIEAGVDLCEVLRERLREDTRATLGFNMLRNSLDLSREEICFLRTVLPPKVLVYLLTEKGVTINSIKKDHWVLAYQVKRLSKKLKSLYSVRKGTKKLIQDVTPILDEIARDLDLRPYGFDSSIDWYLARNIMKKSKSNNAKTFVIRTIFEQLKFILNHREIECDEKIIYSSEWPSEGKWPSDIYLQHPPCHAIARIATALMALNDEIDPSSVSRALHL